MDISAEWTGAVEQINRTLTAKGRRQSGCFSIEGLRLHERALRAGWDLEQTLISPSLLAAPSEREQNLLSFLSTRSELVVVPETTMETLTNGRALGALISRLAIPPAATFADQVTAVDFPLVLVAANIIDPGNIGAMIRTGHAHHMTVFVTIGAGDPFHPKAVRTSMGSLFKTAVNHFPTITPLLQECRRLGLETVGTVAHHGVLLPTATFSKKGIVVVMGNEYEGLPAAVSDRLDTLVSIPMATGIDSLSVNAATAVVLYEINQKQR